MAEMALYEIIRSHRNARVGLGVVAVALLCGCGSATQGSDGNWASEDGGANGADGASGNPAGSGAASDSGRGGSSGASSGSGGSGGSGSSSASGSSGGSGAGS